MKDSERTPYILIKRKLLFYMPFPRTCIVDFVQLGNLNYFVNFHPALINNSRYVLSTPKCRTITSSINLQSKFVLTKMKDISFKGA